MEEVQDFSAVVTLVKFYNRIAAQPRKSPIPEPIAHAIERLVDNELHTEENLILYLSYICSRYPTIHDAFSKGRISNFKAFTSQDSIVHWKLRPSNWEQCISPFLTTVACELIYGKISIPPQRPVEPDLIQQHKLNLRTLVDEDAVYELCILYGWYWEDCDNFCQTCKFQQQCRMRYGNAVVANSVSPL